MNRDEILDEKLKALEIRIQAGHRVFGHLFNREELFYLNPVDRNFYVLMNLDFQVCTGGFSQWCENGFLDEVDFVKYALHVLSLSSSGEELTTQVGTLVDQAKIIFEDQKENLDYEDDKAHAKRYDALDSAYDEIRDAFLDLILGIPSIHHECDMKEIETYRDSAANVDWDKDALDERLTELSKKE